MIEQVGTEQTKDEAYIRVLVERARKAMEAIEGYDQKRVDRLCQAIGWATAKEECFTYLTRLGINESGMGDYKTRCGKRFKIYGVLRDILREKSVGIIEEIPEKGIVKYAKPAGVLAGVVPCTNSVLTPAVTALFALKCKDAVIFSPHPRTKKTTLETVRIMREALKKEGAPADLFQCIVEPTVPLIEELMRQCDLTMATGGQNLVRAAYSSGTPAYGVGAGNAIIIVDETANVKEAAEKIPRSKINDNGSGCSCDSCLIVEERVYEALLEELQKEGGYRANLEEKVKLQSALWDERGRRTAPTIAVSATEIAQFAGFTLPENRTFLIVEETGVGKSYPFSGEKLCPVVAVYRYADFKNALELVERILDYAGKGHSCGIYSSHEEHIERLIVTAKVSRVMVRQPQSLSNAGSFTNGMPMTASLGCGIWGGNITNENIVLKHYMNVTWVSREIPEDRPSEEVLFGEFYGT